MLVYKILRPSEWDAFDASGTFDGAPVDRESGFIHLSSREQVAETARRHFAEDPVLVIVAIDDATLGATLRWESSSQRGAFPHAYGQLRRADVAAVYRAAGASDVDRVLEAE